MTDYLGDLAHRVAASREEFSSAAVAAVAPFAETAWERAEDSEPAIAFREPVDAPFAVREVRTATASDETPFPRSVPQFARVVEASSISRARARDTDAESTPTPASAELRPIPFPVTPNPTAPESTDRTLATPPNSPIAFPSQVATTFEASKSAETSNEATAAVATLDRKAPAPVAPSTPMELAMVRSARASAPPAPTRTEFPGDVQEREMIPRPGAPSAPFVVTRRVASPIAPAAQPAVPAETVVHVSIGRVEVRAAVGAKSPPAAARPSARSLEDYLRGPAAGGAP